MLVSLLENICQAVLLGGAESVQAAQMRTAEHQGLKRPHRPKRHQRHKFVVLADDALALLEFDLEGVTEQAGVMQLVIGALVGQLRGRLVGNMFGGPDLAVGMGIAGPHHGAAILEYLHVTNLRPRTSSMNSAVQASTTRTMSATSMPARVRLWSG